MLEDLLLGQSSGQVQLTAKAHALGDLALEDLLQRADADGGEHRIEVLRGDGCVAAQLDASLATQRGLVGSGVHQRLTLGGVGHAHLDQPALAVGVLVDRGWIIGEGIVDGDDLPGERRYDIRDGLDGLHLRIGSVLGERGADRWRVEEDDLAERVLGVPGDAERGHLRIFPIDARPIVLGVVKQVMGKAGLGHRRRSYARWAPHARARRAMRWSVGRTLRGAPATSHTKAQRSKVRSARRAARRSGALLYERLAHDSRGPLSPAHVDLQAGADLRAVRRNVGEPDAPLQTWRERAAGHFAAAEDRVALARDAGSVDGEGDQLLGGLCVTHRAHGVRADEARALLAAPAKPGFDRPSIEAEVIAVKMEAGLQAEPVAGTEAGGGGTSADHPIPQPRGLGGPAKQLDATF